MKASVSFLSKVFFSVAVSLMISQWVVAEPRVGLDNATKYRVVINHEEQYSIWATDREIPSGWKATGFTGSREETLQHIEEVWTDMRPLSKRRQLAEEIYRKHKARK